VASSIYFENGTCKCPNATAGDTADINGVSYKAVDNSTIVGQIANSNVNLCTTLVTNMQNLFSGKANFNSDIGFWDTSNITNMDRMFENASSFNQNISGWCVSNINSEPTNFLFNSALTEDNKPVWGTCPNGSVDTTPPVISLLGSSTINLTVGDTFTDPGATATDDVDGDITSSITINGYVLPITQSYSSEVDTSTAGTYTISFYVSDASGNAATVVQRTVIVSVAATTYSISVTASSNSDYTLSGTDANGSVSGDDISITINSGDTLSFTVDAASHPFYIKTVQGTGTDNQASDINSNYPNGATNGVVSWKPTAAGTYYYQCSVHDGMYGTITVQ
jgi:surface protein